ncbi:hypothetical protein [Fictibacillus sp. UD]|uniref:hypothetical protein n=1 Tax=Fictibacillus sp. UD TaxID=3038777 RepID=UPI003748BD86
MAQSGRRLTARPVESEPPGAEINYYQKQLEYEKSFYKRTRTVKSKKRRLTTDSPHPKS